MEAATALMRSFRAVRAELQRIGQHVPLFLEAAEAHHVGDAGHRFELPGDHPILPASKLARRVVVALQGVLVHLSHRGIVGPQIGAHTIGQLGIAQPLGDLLAREVNIDVVLEGDDDLGEPERRDGPLHQRIGRADQGALDGDGDLLLDLLGSLPGVEGDDHDLDVGHVGEGLNLELAEGEDAEEDEGKSSGKASQSGGLLRHR